MIADREWESIGRLPQLLLYAICALVLLFLMLPIFIVVPISFSSSLYLDFPPRGFSLQWYERFLNSPEWTAAFWTSLQVAILATLLASALGTAAALGLTRSRFPGKSLVVGLLLSPMIIPVIVLAIALYAVYAKAELVGSVLGLVLAHSALGLPFVIVTVSATLQRVDERLEHAAVSLGATPFRAFWHIVFPLIRPGMIAGAVFAFIASWDEVVIALFISGTRSATLPKRMWEGLRTEIDPTIAAVSTLLIVVSVVLMLVVEWLRRRSARLAGSMPGGGGN